MFEVLSVGIPVIGNFTFRCVVFELQGFDMFTQDRITCFGFNRFVRI
jgi:hypothetical protein